jgi:hypothetical protein
MSKYLKVVISGPLGDETHYVELEDREEPYSDQELAEIGLDCVNEQYPWGIGDRLYEEHEVPERER